MKKNESRRKAIVYADWEFIEGPILMGILYSENVRGEEVFSFEYDKEWLKSGYAQILDPDLQLYEGIQYVPHEENKTNFGIFMDSSPDKWGRILMRRKETILAREEKRNVRALLQFDYLLGVYDKYRTGALRFKENEDGKFLNADDDIPAPPITSIRELSEYSLRFEKEEAARDGDYSQWLKLLIAQGSSLGGARPKASVIGTDGQLWIAKFPSSNDFSDIEAWEKVAHELARNAGINVPETTLFTVANSKHTFLSKRFDRLSNGKRLHFASAMTLLGFKDGDSFKEGVSYLDIIEFIVNNGSNVLQDLEELWRRIVFFICISNTDDHLRNHGFILTPMGWTLSPVYDLNPKEDGTGLLLNINENDNTLDIELAMDIIKYCRISKKRAEEIINQVKKSVCNWKGLADLYKIPKSEQELKSIAFSKAQ